MRFRNCTKQLLFQTEFLYTNDKFLPLKWRRLWRNWSSQRENLKIRIICDKLIISLPQSRSDCLLLLLLDDADDFVLEQIKILNYSHWNLGDEILNASFIPTRKTCDERFSSRLVRLALFRVRSLEVDQRKLNSSITQCLLLHRGM